MQSPLSEAARGLAAALCRTTRLARETALAHKSIALNAGNGDCSGAWQANTSDSSFREVTILSKSAVSQIYGDIRRLGTALCASYSAIRHGKNGRSVE